MDKFSPRHLIFLIMATGIVSLKTYPTIFIDTGGKESWVGVIVASLLIFVFYLFTFGTLKMVEGYNIVTLYRDAVGKPLGTFFLLLFCLTLFLVLVESASVQSDSMHQNMMVETPHWYFMLFFVLPALYVVRKDLVAVVTVTIIGILLIMLAGINLGILTVKQKHFMYLFPVFQEGISAGFWVSLLKIIGMYGAISITFPYLAHIDDKKYSLKKNVALALLIIIQMQIVSITGIFMTFSEKKAASYYYPKLVQTHLVSYFQIMEFGELYVMLQTLGGWLLKYLVAFHAIVQMLRFWGWRKKTISIATFVITALVLGLTYLTTFTSIRLFTLLDWFSWVTLLNFVVIPLVVCCLYRLNRALKSTPQAP